MADDPQRDNPIEKMRFRLKIQSAHRQDQSAAAGYAAGRKWAIEEASLPDLEWFANEVEFRRTHQAAEPLATIVWQERRELAERYTEEEIQSKGRNPASWWGGFASGAVDVLREATRGG